MMDEWVTLTIEDLCECAQLYVQGFNSAPWNDQWTVEKAHKLLPLPIGRRMEGIFSACRADLLDRFHGFLPYMRSHPTGRTEETVEWEGRAWIIKK